MNPLDLPGPQFLAFYAALAAVVLVAFRMRARAISGPPEGPAPIDLGNVDPYLVAYLRGRESEVARVVILSLLDRGLLVASGDELEAGPGVASKVRRPLERAVLEAFASKAKAASIFRDARFKLLTGGLSRELEQKGLLPDDRARGRILSLRLALAVLLAGTATAKIVVALQRGRHNLGFLVVMAAFSTLLLLVLAAPVRTRLGDSALESLRSAFSHLKDRAAQFQPGGATTELVLLAAIFGIGALSGSALVQAETLFPTAMKAAQGGGTDGGSSCGSSCGATSSCGGSSCGGGGCGGGCGGCGG